jgi:hypothetical protein
MLPGQWSADKVVDIMCYEGSKCRSGTVHKANMLEVTRKQRLTELGVAWGVKRDPASSRFPGVSLAHKLACDFQNWQATSLTRAGSCASDTEAALLIDDRQVADGLPRLHFTTKDDVVEARAEAARLRGVRCKEHWVYHAQLQKRLMLQLSSAMSIAQALEHVQLVQQQQQQQQQQQ